MPKKNFFFLLRLHNLVLLSYVENPQIRNKKFFNPFDKSVYSLFENFILKTSIAGQTLRSKGPQQSTKICFRQPKLFFANYETAIHTTKRIFFSDILLLIRH